MKNQSRAGFGPWMLLWHLLTLVLLMALTGIKTRIPFWSPDNPDHAAIYLAGAYVVSALLLTAMRWRGRPVTVGLAAVVTAAMFGIGFLLYLLHRPVPEISRSIFVLMLVAAAVLAAVGFTLSRFRGGAALLLSIVVIGLVGLQAYRAFGPVKLRPQTTQANLATAFYTLKMTTYQQYLPPTDVRGGGISPIGDQYILATGDGRIYAFDFGGAKQALSIRQLPFHVPINIDEFTHDANPEGYAGKPNGGDEADRLQGVQTWQFRTAAIRVQELGDRVRVFVSHHYWKRDQKCFVVRVSSMSGTRAAFLAGDLSLHWDTVFESQPCVPLRGDDSVHENNPFAGMEIGGRLGFLSEQRLLLTLGDHDFTGVETKLKFSQEPNVSYGKTVLIHLDDGSSEIYTLGHRNPQGLYITPQGEVWSTEHGPQGGDELNLLVRGANYGWPLVTYGTDYGSAAWPLSQVQGRHDGYQQPTFVWVPSIGVSNLVRIEQDRMPVWKGDLIVSSLHAHSLFRLRLLGDRVVFSEPIEVGERVRDIVEGHDGRLIMWTDTSSIVTLSPADGTDGAVLFATTCGGCHKAIDGATHSYGPDLAGIVGAKVASAPGFGAYSPALKGLGGKWTPERLDAFLADPQAMASGSAMTFRGVKDADQRAAIIKYLGTTSRF